MSEPAVWLPPRLGGWRNAALRGRPTTTAEPIWERVRRKEIAARLARDSARRLPVEVWEAEGGAIR